MERLLIDRLITGHPVTGVEGISIEAEEGSTEIVEGSAQPAARFSPSEPRPRLARAWEPFSAARRAQPSARFSEAEAEQPITSSRGETGIAAVTNRGSVFLTALACVASGNFLPLAFFVFTGYLQGIYRAGVQAFR